MKKHLPIIKVNQFDTPMGKKQEEFYKQKRDDLDLEDITYPREWLDEQGNIKESVKQGMYV